MKITFKILAIVSMIGGLICCIISFTTNTSNPVNTAGFLEGLALLATGATALVIISLIPKKRTQTFDSYLQKAWGDSIDNVSIADVRTAITETLQMDDEHGAFWVSIVEDHETVLETHKDLTVMAIFPDRTEITSKFTDRDQIEGLYELFLNKKFEEVKETLKTNSRIT